MRGQIIVSGYNKIFFLLYFHIIPIFQFYRIIQAWLGAISFLHEDLWKKKAIKRNEWDEINANDSTMIPFTFPLPKYVL